MRGARRSGGSRARRWAAIAAAVLLSAGAVGAGAYAWLASARGREWLRAKLVERVDAAIQGRFDADALELHGLRFGLHGLVLRTREGALVARADRLSGIPLLPLARGRVVLDGAVVEGAELRVWRDRGRMGLLEAIAPSRGAGGGGEALDLRSITLERGEVGVLRAAGAPPAALLGGIAGRVVSAGGALEVRAGGRIVVPANAPFELVLRRDPRSGEIDVRAGAAGATATGSFRAGRVVLREVALPPEAARQFLPTYPIAVPLRARGEVRVEGGRATFSGSGALGAAGFRAEGEVSPETRSLRRFGFEIERLDLRAALGRGPPTDLTATLRGEELSLDPASPRGRATLQVGPGRVGAARISSAEVAAEAGGGELRVRSLRVEADGLRLRGEATSDGRRIAAEARVDVSGLAVASALAGRELGIEGAGTLRISLRGPLRDPALTLDTAFASLRRGALRAARVTLVARVPHLRSPSIGRARIRAAWIAVGRWHAPELRAHVAASDSAVAAALVAGSRTGARARATVRLARGTEEGRLEASGSAAASGIAGAFRLRGGAEGIRLDASAADGAARARLAATSAMPPRKLVEALRRGRGERVPVEVELHAGPVAIARLARRAGRPLQAQGELTVDAAVHGTAAAPIGEARIRIAGAGPAGRALLDGTATMRFHAGAAELSGEGTVRGGGAVRLSGRVTDLRGDAAVVNASVRAERVAAALVAGALPGVRGATGEITATATIEGTLRAPRVGGALAWDGGLETEAAGRFEGVRLRARLVDGALEIDELRAASGGGTLEAHGRIEGRLPPRSAEVEARAVRFPIVTGSEERVRLSAAVHGAASCAVGACAADVWIRELAVALPRGGPEGVQDLDRPGDIHVLGPGSRRPSILPHPLASAWRVTLNADGVALAGPTIDARIVPSPGLLLERGAPGTPWLAHGTIRIVAGSLEVVGERFAFLAGSEIRFDGPIGEPGIAIAAGGRIGDGDARLTVQGTGGQVALEVTAPVLGGDASPFAIFEGRLRPPGGWLRGVIVPKLPLPQIVSQGLAASTYETGTFLTGRIWLGSATEIPADLERGENVHARRLGYRLVPRFRLEGVYGDAGTGDLDVAWVREWPWPALRKRPVAGATREPGAVGRAR